jgi:hypothetical protein
MQTRVVALLARTLARGQRQSSVVGVITAEDAARMIYGAAYLLAQQKLSGQPQAEISRFFDAIMRVLASTVLGGRHEVRAKPKAKKKPRPANNLAV